MSTNVALVGCGHIHTPGFVKRLQARDDINVTAVWDHDAERAQMPMPICLARPWSKM